jgi:hypothetical protein
VDAVLQSYSLAANGVHDTSYARASAFSLAVRRCPTALKRGMEFKGTSAFFTARQASAVAHNPARAELARSLLHCSASSTMACKSTTLSFSFVTIIVTAGLNTFEFAHEQAAISLGGRRLRACMGITPPQLRTLLNAVAFLAFIASFDERVIVMFDGGSSMTLPRKLFDNILLEIDPTIAAVDVLTNIVVSVLLAQVARFGAGAGTIV